jgi:transcriptional regulator GlxA family with amidase domain
VITRSRHVALLLFDEVEILDFAGTVQILTLAGRHWNWRPFKIHTVAETPGLIGTCNQLRVEATLRLSDCPGPEVVILPGGYGAVRAARSPAVVSWLSAVLPKAQLICTVGNGALLLAAAERVDGGSEGFAGHTVSVPQNTSNLLKEAGSSLVANTVERLIAGTRVVSIRSCEASVDLGLQVVERMLGASLRKKVQAELMLAGEAPPIDLTSLPDGVNVD